jgi:hypothetical protein
MDSSKTQNDHNPNNYKDGDFLFWITSMNPGYCVYKKLSDHKAVAVSSGKVEPATFKLGSNWRYATSEEIVTAIAVRMKA